jgi:hypothetical protein
MTPLILRSPVQPSGSHPAIATTLWNGEETIDVIALLGITDPIVAASSMRRLGWFEAEIARWLGT